jgi:hypothetical protein
MLYAKGVTFRILGEIADEVEDPVSRGPQLADHQTIVGTMVTLKGTARLIDAAQVPGHLLTLGLGHSKDASGGHGRRLLEAPEPWLAIAMSLPAGMSHP